MEESDERGHKQRTTRNRDAKRGTPQGGVLSPLLANLYMRRFVRVGKYEDTSGVSTRTLSTTLTTS